MRLVFVLALALSATSAHAGPETNAQVGATAPRELSQVCSYYSNRARFLRRTEPGSLIIALADSCEMAIDRLSTPDVYFRPDEGEEDRRFIQHLADLKRVIVEMNVARFATRATEGTRRVQSVVQSVTPTGEYLIARRMGVLSAYRSWQDATQPELAADAALPLRVEEEM